VSFRSPLLLASLAAWALTVSAPGFDRRVVDTAEAGNPESEAEHGYVGSDAVTGVAGGKPFRQARGWMRYALATFEDTEVTVACTFVSSDSVPRSYDVLVEDSLIATRTLNARSAQPTVVEVKVPFGLTKGRTNIAVIIRARGGPTPALRELRVIQDHNEYAYNRAGLAPPRELTRPSPGLHNPLGVAR